MKSPLAIGPAIAQGVALGFACLMSYVLITRTLTLAYFISRDDALLGGMWAVVATVFVYQDTYEESSKSALSRMAATLISFTLCLIYLLVFPFHAWGMAALVGLGTAILTLIGRPEHIIKTGITTAVVMVVAGIGPQHAWKQPILRLVDTTVGTLVGMGAAWLTLTFRSKTHTGTA